MTPVSVVVSAMATCYRHPNRETGVSCSNCGRPICPDCMTPTTVGMRCPECSRQRTKVVTMRSMVTQPRVTYALIAINVIAFLAEGSYNVGSGASGGTVYHKGALLGSSTLPGWADQGVAHGQWWRIVTGGFLHAGFLHIFMNMLALYWIGIALEPAIGSLRFAIIYGVSLLAGSLGALLVSPHTPTVGASGAVFGLLGALAVEYRARGISLAESQLGIVIVLNLVFSFTIPGISWGGHIGGLIGGALAMSAFHMGARLRSEVAAISACLVIAVACIAGSIATAHSSDISATALPPQVTSGP